LSDEDWKTARLVLELRMAAKGGKGMLKAKEKVKYTFTLQQVDPKGLLKEPKREVDFSTGISCKDSAKVKVRLEGLKVDGKRGKEAFGHGPKGPEGVCNKTSNEREGLDAS